MVPASTKILADALLQKYCCPSDNNIVDAFGMKNPIHMMFEKAGRNQSELARRLGTSQQRVAYLLAKDRPLPADLVLPAESAFGVPRHDIRPDLYPREGEAA